MSTSTGSQADQYLRRSRWALITLIGFMIVGVFFIFLYALQAPSLGEWASVFGLGIMIAGAALAIGGLLGFLFGIPHTVQHRPEDDQAEPGIAYQVNTSLEQISDWLTKILIGVGLTQLILAPGALRDLAEYLSGGLGGYESSEAFGAVIILYFLVGGFLFGYLWTRLFMIGALVRADLDMVTQAELQKVIQEQQAQEEARTTALRLVQSQLEHSGTESPVDQAQLNKAIAAVQPSTRLEIFEKTREIRRKTWKERVPDPDKIMRTVPVFRALAETPTEGIEHRAYGEIGFALKDVQLAIRALKRGSDEWMNKEKWQDAAHALTRAGEIRDELKDDVGHLYEVNRAICRIVLDEGYRAGLATADEQARRAIVADLTYAVTERHDWLFKCDRRNPRWMDEYAITQAWLKLNAEALPDTLRNELRTDEEAQRGNDVDPAPPVPTP